MSYMNYNNPYQQPIQNFVPQQQQMFSPMQNQLISKIVESEEAVKYQDIPVDGKTYYFLKADGTEIYSKKWLPNCTTEIKTFKEVENSSDTSVVKMLSVDDFNDFKDGVFEKLNAFDDKFIKLEKAFSSRNNSTKKEV